MMHECLKMTTVTTTSHIASPHGLLHFIAELRRRRVCRAITLYSVAMWLVCQIIDVIEGPIGLPDWTLSLVLVLGLLGLPIALILSWLFDITPQGVVPDGPVSAVDHADPAPRRPSDQAIDCALLVAALLIGGQLAHSTLTRDVVAAPPDVPRISVMTFQSVSRIDASGLATGLIVELQHALVGLAHVTVVDVRDGGSTANTRTIAGVIAIDDVHIRVTATLIDTKTREIIWSHAFVRPNTGSAGTIAALAQDIVQALPIPKPQPVAAAASSPGLE